MTASSFPPTSISPSESSPAAMGQVLSSEPRRAGETAIPVPTSGLDITIPASTSGYAVPTTAGDDTTQSGLLENPPPIYRDEDNNMAQIAPSERTTRVQPEEEAERARQYDVRIADFCATNRDLISHSLERKLHAARYLPEDDPNDVPAEYWHNTYGVEFFELRRLQTAYERFVSVIKRTIR